MSQRRVEAREVDERVGHEEEIGNDGSNEVEISNANAHGRDEKGEHVAAPRLVATTATLAEIGHARKQVVLAHSLKDLGCAHETGECGRERRREDAGRDEDRQGGDHLHHSIVVEQAVLALDSAIVARRHDADALDAHLARRLARHRGATNPRESTNKSTQIEARQLEHQQ